MEAYCLAAPGKEYAVYFPAGGKVRLDARGLQGQCELRWYDIDGGRWASAARVPSGQPILLAAPSLEPGDELLNQTLLLGAGLDDAVAFAAFQVEIKPIDSQPVGPRTRPIGVLENRGALAGIEQSVVAEPGVEVELAAEVGEAVVAHDEDRGARAVAVVNVAENRIEALVEPLDVAEPLLGLACGARRMRASEFHQKMCDWRSLLEK
jgi:hypothetical protein